MAITFDPTVVALKFFTSFQKPFSMGFLCNRYSATWRSGQLDLNNESKWP
jgi:hypothetical protein